MTHPTDNIHTHGQAGDTGYYAVDAQRVILLFETFQMRPSHFAASGQSGAQGIYYAARDIIKGRTRNRWGHHTPRALKSFCHFTQSENGTLVPWRELVEHRSFYDGKEGAGRRTGNLLQTEQRLRLDHEAMTAARWQGGLSQEQLAEKAALPLRFFELLETGDWGSVTGSTARSIAEALGVAEETLFTHLPEPAQPEADDTPEAPQAAIPATSQGKRNTLPMKKWLQTSVAGVLLWGGYQFYASSRQPAASNPQAGTAQQTAPAPDSGPESGPRRNAASGSALLTGCWNWSNGAHIVIDAEGIARNGPFSGTWKTADGTGKNYTITWPSFIDTLTLSADGSTLSGTNNFGIPVSATRKSGNVPGVTGSWLWNTGITVTIRSDASINGGAFSGTWSSANNKWIFEWPLVDTISLAADGDSLSWRNQFGAATAKRDAGCTDG
ncbi:MAG TPA: hypothetical protein ENJ80_03185 [Gammaproteobacteria bacterium]|nr:hypothetical protein [Gammaproteobacteria bacterium]